MFDPAAYLPILNALTEREQTARNALTERRFSSFEDYMYAKGVYDATKSNKAFVEALYQKQLHADEEEDDDAGISGGGRVRI